MENKNKIRRINNPYEIIGNIISYQHDIKIGNRISYLCEHIEKTFKIKDIDEKQLIVYPTSSIWGRYGGLNVGKIDQLHSNAFNNSSIITNRSELSEVLQESKSTIDNWKSSGIIDWYETHIVVVINGEFYQYKRNYGWFSYCNLDEIRSNIRNSIA